MAASASSAATLCSKPSPRLFGGLASGVLAGDRGNSREQDHRDDSKYSLHRRLGSKRRGRRSGGPQNIRGDWMLRAGCDHRPHRAEHQRGAQGPPAAAGVEVPRSMRFSKILKSPPSRSACSDRRKTSRLQSRRASQPTGRPRSFSIPSSVRRTATPRRSGGRAGDRRAPVSAGDADHAQS